MNFSNFLKQIIFKEKELSIINVSDIIYIPDRDFYKDDLGMINLIDIYKEKYLNLLHKNRTITSNELKLDNLQEDIVMNVDLLLHSLINEHYFLNYTSEELMIQMAIFKLYFSEINKMEIEIIARLIALKELKDEKKVLHRNRTCLIEAINSFSNSLVMLKGQKIALEKETQAFLTSISTNNNESDEELLNQRYNKLLFISSCVNIYDDFSKFDSLIAKIAFIERYLEIYAYKNKNEIEKLDIELEELEKIEKTKDNQNELSVKIYSLEKKYLLFYEYGINIVSDEQLKRLYKVKFDMLVSNIDFLRESPINEHDYGYPYYKKIVMEKIQTILKGKNENIKDTFKDHYLHAINVIRDSLKNDDNEFDFDEILKDKYMLNLLVSFDKENGFLDMLDNNILYTTKYKDSNFYEQKFLERFDSNDWNDKISLKSFLSVVHVSDFEKKGFKNWNIYTLYKMINDDDEDRDFYKLPEGIKCLDGLTLSHDLRILLEEKNKFKTIVIPSTLKFITDDLFYKNNHPTLVLNDGLEFIGSYVFSSIDNLSIVIPSSVKEIRSSAFSGSKLKTIIFDDYKNSKILHDEDSLVEMLYLLFNKTKTGKVYYHSLSDEAKEIQQKYSNGGYSTFSSWILYEHPHYEHEVKITSSLDNIILKDGDDTISIKTDELSFLSYIESTGRYINKTYNGLDYISCLTLVEKIQKVILEKTGHDIFEKDNIKGRIKY